MQPNGQTPTVIEVLTDDHREVERMFAEIESLPATETARLTDLTEQVVTELVRHSVAEEQYLYPAAREHLPGGDELTEHEIGEHAEAEETMKRIEKLDADDPQYRVELDTLMRQIRHHLKEEEGDLFPRLAAACDRDELERLGTAVTKAKKLAPTRPHPAAPDRPPLNKLLGPGVALVDRLRDALTGRGRS